MFVLVREFCNIVEDLPIHDRDGAFSPMYPALFFAAQPASSSRILLLFRPLLIIPHIFWAGIYGAAAMFVQFCSFWAIMFTGRHPRALWRFLEGYMRYRSRLTAYMLLLCDRYPPFGGTGDDYAVRMHIRYPERLSRAAVLFRFLLLIPHVFYGIGFAFVTGFVQFLQFWTVLFLGRMANWQYDWIHAWFMYAARVDAYFLYLVDEYPPFNGQQPRAAAEMLP